MEVLDDKRRHKLYKLNLLVFDKYWDLVFNEDNEGKELLSEVRNMYSQFGMRRSGRLNKGSDESIPGLRTLNVKQPQKNVTTTNESTTPNVTITTTNESTTPRNNNDDSLQLQLVRLRNAASENTIQITDNKAIELHQRSIQESNNFRKIFLKYLRNRPEIREANIAIELFKFTSVSFKNYFRSPNLGDFTNSLDALTYGFVVIGGNLIRKSWYEFHQNKNDFATLFMNTLLNIHTDENAQFRQQICDMYKILMPNPVDLVNYYKPQRLFTSVIKSLYFAKTFGVISTLNVAFQKINMGTVNENSLIPPLPKTTFEPLNLMKDLTFIKQGWVLIENLFHGATTSSLSYREQSELLLRNLVTTGIQGGNMDLQTEKLLTYEELRNIYGTKLSFEQMLEEYFGITIGSYFTRTFVGFSTLFQLSENVFSNYYDNAVNEINLEIMTFNSKKDALITTYVTKLINNDKSGLKNIYDNAGLNKSYLLMISKCFIQIFLLTVIVMVAYGFLHFCYKNLYSYSTRQNMSITNNKRVEEIDDDKETKELQTSFGKIFFF